jgi:hypothetical protein
MHDLSNVGDIINACSINIRPKSTNALKSSYLILTLSSLTKIKSNKPIVFHVYQQIVSYNLFPVHDDVQLLYVNYLHLMNTKVY